MECEEENTALSYSIGEPARPDGKNASKDVWRHLGMWSSLRQFTRGLEISYAGGIVNTYTYELGIIGRVTHVLDNCRKEKRE